MGHRTIDLSSGPGTLNISLNRPERQNSIDATMIRELHEALDQAEAATDCRVVVLQGGDGVFCTGMDLLGAAAAGVPDQDGAARGGAEFLELLKRFTTTPRVVVAKVDGRVAGGGVGLAAAADFVFATPASTFSLPEALWGLLPCCVTPFLIRRVGFQKAYAMSLSTQPVTADQAVLCSLADQMADDLGPAIRKLTFRASKLSGPTIGDLKRYFAKMWILSAEQEQTAVDEFARLMSSAGVGRRIADFAERQRFPWEGGS
ncbi:enoyl-CoA hydratase-related protein [Streptomyces sp. NBC_01485]|uniref:enoyl-CoA hydratase-related protein n=1 Tax=Streptomyces sp. NBC_01485 TaxID=2903884 RepID=UPI002E3478DC|nr:enoyl-CoA hydratase-related protein [Streptomyces sp. NBC_01485]